MRDALLSTREQKATAYNDFQKAVELGGYVSDAIESMSVKDLRLLIGKPSNSLTVTYVKNMREKLVRSMKLTELQLIADSVLANICVLFPNAAVKLGRRRVISIYFDGLPKEIEL